MPDTSPQQPAENSIKAILEWLALARNRLETGEAKGLRRELRLLRAIPLAADRRLQLLDLLHSYATQITQSQFPALHEATLPVSRELRQRVRDTQDMLEALARDYQAISLQLSLTETPQLVGTLRRTGQCLAWHLIVSHLVAAPVGPNIWQQLHSIYRSARQLSIDDDVALADWNELERIYLSCILISVAQPASFNSKELDFIGRYIAPFLQDVTILAETPPEDDGVFWVEPERDSPPHALVRRPPPPGTPVFYFACGGIAKRAAEHRKDLENGRTARELGLPSFADSHAGRGTLKRLSNFWGSPAKRKFPRRRQSYRADLCAGLDSLWQLLATPREAAPPASEWMITNESPDGYSMMHVSGDTEQLRVGDIVTLRPRRDDTADDLAWQICMVRWALSENPEHIELGLQVVARRGIPAMVFQPFHPEKTAGGTQALLLPEAPPLRPSQALVVPAGAIFGPGAKLIAVVEERNVAIFELNTVHLDEQTASVEIFTVAPDERQ